VSSDETRMRTEKAYVNKLNLVLVQVSSSSHGIIQVNDS